MRKILLVFICLILIKGMYAQDHKFPYYKDFVDWGAYILTSDLYKKTEKYIVEGIDTLKEQEIFYSKGKISQKVNYDIYTDDRRQVHSHEIYEWNNDLLERIIGIDYDGYGKVDTSILLFENKFPVVKEYSVRKGEKVLNIIKHYNKDSTLDKEFRYFNNGDLYFKIEFSYYGSTITSKSIKDTTIESESIYQTIDPQNKLWYFMEPNNYEVLSENKNYNKMYMFVKSSLNERGQTMERITSFRDGNYIIAKNNYHNFRLILSENTYNDCKHTISIYKYYE